VSFNGAVATFTDPAGAEANDGVNYLASINWGDGTGSTPGTLTPSGSTFTVNGNHTYTKQGSYTVTTTITHKGVVTTTTTTATVA
jgi:hypothetical protein